MSQLIAEEPVKPMTAPNEWLLKLCSLVSPERLVLSDMLILPWKQGTHSFHPTLLYLLCVWAFMNIFPLVTIIVPWIRHDNACFKGVKAKIQQLGVLLSWLRLLGGVEALIPELMVFLVHTMWLQYVSYLLPFLPLCLLKETFYISKWVLLCPQIHIPPP